MSALAASCLLHAAAILLPTLGERSSAEKPAGHLVRPLRAAFTATLTVARKDTAPVQDSQPESGTVTDALPLPDRADKEAPSPGNNTRGADALPIPGPAYYTTDQLTKRPRAISVAELDTPETKRIIVSGKIILQLWIDSQGQVVDVAVEQSGLPKIFSETAANAFRNSRFTPGERNGLPVGTLMRIEVSYDDKLGAGP